MQQGEEEHVIKEFELTNIEINSIELDPSNPNVMSKEQMSAMRKSMQQYGYLAPVIVDKNNKICDGEHRVLIYKELGLSTIPAYRVDLNSDTDRKQLRQIMNKLHGEHDRAKDADELVEILQAAQDKTFKELSELIAKPQDDLYREVLRYHPDLDYLSPENKEDVDKLIDEEMKRIAPDTALGDIYQLGDHRLMCADSTDSKSVDRLMDGKIADICFTSPPYNAGSGNLRSESTYNVKVYLHDNDQLSDSTYLELLSHSLSLILEQCHECYYNIGLIGLNKVPVIEFMYQYRKSFKDLFYWVKDQFGVPDPNEGNLQNRVELILIFSKEDNSKRIRHANFPVSTLSDVIAGPKVQHNEYAEFHRATFPQYIPEHIITNCTKRGDVVLDPFIGTGTTLIAAEQAGRTCYGIDIDPHYVDISVKRWEKYTGQKAVKVS